MNKYLLLFALLVSLQSFGQSSDSSRRQIEISGVGYKLNRVLYTQYSLGVNFAAKKENWYTNLALSVNTHDATKRGGSIFTVYTLSIGKSYQWTNNHFFATLGGNAGPLYGVYTNSPKTIRHIGIGLIPKAELGYNMKRIILSTGIYQAAGACFRAEYNYGVFEVQSKPSHYIRFTGALNLYVKLILK
jgi:hypothetical protein